MVGEEEVNWILCVLKAHNLAIEQAMEASKLLKFSVLNAQNFAIEQTADLHSSLGLQTVTVFGQTTEVSKLLKTYVLNAQDQLHRNKMVQPRKNAP